MTRRGLFFCAASLLAVAMIGLGARPEPGPGPEPELGAREVVAIQIEALSRNDQPDVDSGIRTAFRFASPGNRSQTGPIERFATMVRSDAYRPMIGNRDAEVGEARLHAGQAWVPVILTSADGRRHGYVFILSRQDGGECDGCWMTDGVVPHPLPRGQEGPRLI